MLAARCARLICCFLTLLLLPVFAHTAPRIGIFPVRNDPVLNPGYLARDDLAAHTTDQLLQELQMAEIGEVVLLPWPAGVGADEKPTFESYVGIGQSAGCSGVVVARLNKTDFVNAGEGQPNRGTATAEFGGGVIDTARAAALGSIDTRVEKTQRIEGPLPGQLPGVDVRSEEYANSLLGVVLAEARANVVARASALAADLPDATDAPEERAGARNGVSFARDSFSMIVPVGYDRRGMVAVVNRGTTSERFIIKPVDVPDGVTIGLIGAGSIDGSCDLRPGEWKYVRFVANTDHAVRASIGLGLFLVDEGGTAAADAEPVDRAVMELETTWKPIQLAISVTGEDPVTLARTVSVSNHGADDAWPVYVDFAGSGIASVDIVPRPEGRLMVPAGGSLEFVVTPAFSRLRTPREITVSVTDGFQRTTAPLPLRFELPEGKRQYWGLARSTADLSHEASACINEGGIVRYTNRERVWCDFGEGGFQCGPGTHNRPGAHDCEDEEDRPDEEVDLGGRGGIVRPAVARRLPKIEEHNLYSPVISYSNNFVGSTYYYPVYVSIQDGARSIAAVPLSAQGQPAGQPVTLSAGADCGEPQISCGAGGDLYAVWREGDGAASEVWFASRPAGATAWTAARALTADSAYSEYPNVVAGEESLYVSYHSDLSGVADFIYAIRSTDGGATWTEPELRFSSQPNITRAWLEVHMAPAHSRDAYRLSTITCLLNGEVVGELENTLPDGTYIFPVRPELVAGASGAFGGNNLEVQVTDINGGHFVVCSRLRLIAEFSYTMVRVVASSQAEADRLAQANTPGVNHTLPDLVAAADPLRPLPVRFEPGDKVTVPIQVTNMGSAAATDVSLTLFRRDPSGAAFDPDQDTLCEAQLGTVEVGEVRPEEFTFDFDPANTARVYAVLRGDEADFSEANNTWAITLTQGFSEEASPLVGTDIPNVFAAPSLCAAAEISDLNAMRNFVARPDYRTIVLGLGVSPEELAAVDSWQAQLQALGVPIPGVELPGVEAPLPKVPEIPLPRIRLPF